MTRPAYVPPPFLASDVKLRVMAHEKTMHCVVLADGRALWFMRHDEAAARAEVARQPGATYFSPSR